ncbi:MAG TPA: phenylalanine--tRNA ligase subunit beta [Flavipsychrobacter sp.]|nr:phenylalanine--tRNA ligase subunit beta [Flavipsychrobacter sp.]
MTISYQWLLSYLPEALSIDDLSNILTSIGLEVEGTEAVEAVKGSLEGLIIAEVVTCGKHPNADKLSITTVNTGNGEAVQVVCGAPNVAAGQRIVFAPVGATVHPTEGDSFLIKKAKIRGEESSGMICAEDEIGLGNSHAGIMILPADAPIGTPAKKYFNIADADQAIHIGLTPNRSDAMSHIGVARDVCAYLTHHRGSKYHVQLPQSNISSAAQQSVSVKVNIDAPDACPRYMGISIAGVKVAPSPDWLQQRLNTIGVRSINNIVDITNFVLHEYGQPLHAFDADRIKGSTINVRFLPAGTVFKGLDEKEYKLNDNDLMICDAEGPVAIGGVFGGLHSGVSDATINIFLESAYFDKMHVRRTSMHHGLRTDAATHFEKGVDMNNVYTALNRAAALICEIAGGTIASDVVDNYPKKFEPVMIDVSYSYICKLSGKKYEPAAIQEILKALDFEIESEDANGLIVRVPSNKIDVLQPADIVEEILRIDGLDNIEMDGRLNIALTKTVPNSRAARQKISSLLCGMGFQEIVTNSIVNSKYYPDRTDLVRMLNSLSSELDIMRPAMLESGLEVILYNYNRKNQDLLLFEFGKIYTQAEGNYIENQQLALWITGNVQQAQWNSKAVKADLFYLKGVVQNLLAQSGIDNAVVAREGNEQVWKWKNQPICTISAVDAKKLKDFDLKQDVYHAVINAETWQKAAAASKIKYTEVPKFPAVQRDIAIVLDKQVPYSEVEKVTRQLKLDSLQSFGLFDVFESEKLGAGKKSYALNYTFQLQDRTLTDAEIEQLMQQLMGAYKNKLQAQIRE